MEHIKESLILKKVAKRGDELHFLELCRSLLQITASHNSRNSNTQNVTYINILFSMSGGKSVNHSKSALIPYFTKFLLDIISLFLGNTNKTILPNLDHQSLQHKNLDILEQNPTLISVSIDSNGSLNFAFSLSSSNESMRF